MSSFGDLQYPEESNTESTTLLDEVSVTACFTVGQLLFMETSPCTLMLFQHFIHSTDVFFKFIYFYLFYYCLYLFSYFLSSLGLRCCARAFFSCHEQGLLFSAARGLLIAVASFVAEHRLQAHRLQ